MQSAFVVALSVSALGFSVASATPLAPAAWHGPVAPPRPVVADTPTAGPVSWMLPRRPVRPPSLSAAQSFEAYVTSWSVWAPPIEVAPAIVETVSYDPNKSAMADLVILERPPIETIELRGLTLLADPLSKFTFDIEPTRRVVTVGLADDDTVQFEIDYRDGPRDVHRTGIAPVFLGRKFESTLEKSRGERIFPLVTPTFDAGRVVHTTIATSVDQLRVRFDTGPYSNLKPEYEDQGGTFLEARITVTEGVTRMELDGLYYVRPSSNDTVFSVKGNDGYQGAVVTAGVPAFVDYIADPKRIDVEDGTFGYYKIKTDAEWLQVQWNGVGSAFEFDFDHTYKDRQQLSTKSRIVFAPVVEEADESEA